MLSAHALTIDHDKPSLITTELSIQSSRSPHDIPWIYRHLGKEVTELETGIVSLKRIRINGDY